MPELVVSSRVLPKIVWKALRLLTRRKSFSDGQAPPLPWDGRECWTTISFAPTSFFDDSDNSISPDVSGAWPNSVVHNHSGQVVEIFMIIKALKTVQSRWRQLERYISGLLTQDFMNPDDYCKLLFDDDSFSWSKLYFWIIGILIDVLPSIEDTINQWDLYREARIGPLVEDKSGKNTAQTKVQTGTQTRLPGAQASNEIAPPKTQTVKETETPKDPIHNDIGLPDDTFTSPYDSTTISIIRQYDEQGKEVKRELENLKKRFKAINDSVEALREGVCTMAGFSFLKLLTYPGHQIFNASALVESRSATRLGEDVQLLTYVSMFYLPLGFCAVSRTI